MLRLNVRLREYQPLRVRLSHIVTPGWLLSVAVLVAVTASMLVAQDNALVLDRQGKVLVPFRRTGKLSAVRVVVENGAAPKPAWDLRCRFLRLYDNEAVPLLSDAVYPGKESDNDFVFTVPVDKRSEAFLFCSLSEVLNGPVGPVEGKKLDEEASALIEEERELQKPFDESPEKRRKDAADTAEKDAVANQEARLKEANDAIGNVEAEVKQLTADIAAFQQSGTDSAVAEIKRIQDLVRLKREQISKARVDLDGLKKKLKDLVDTAEKNLKGAEESLSETAAAKRLAEIKKRTDAIHNRFNEQYRVLNTSHLFLDDRDRLMVYRVVPGNPDKSIALERVPREPVLTTESRVFALIINRHRTVLPERFRLSFSTSPGTTPNPAPVRPTVQVPVMVAQGGTAIVFLTDDAYSDFALAFGRTFPGNTVIKATIASFLRVTTKDETTVTTVAPEKQETLTTAVQSVDLIKDEEYPQVRHLYRYNFTTGVVFSALKDPSFVRVKTKFDDPATADKNETEYANAMVKGGISIRPIFAITIYPKAVDIQQSPRWYERLLPAPTIGFAFQNPHENMYLGLTHEVFRNFQFMYGVHIGKVTELQSVGGLDDPSKSDGPATTKRFHGGAFAGISFNIEFFRSIFKIP